jgi:hypothetical protein
MALLSDYITQVQELVHDTASIDYTTAEMTNFVNGARNHVALDFHNVRYLFQNASLIAGQEQYPIFGGVCGLNIVNGGGNYVNPVISIAAPGGAGNVTATAQAVVSAGVITQVNMTNYGTGYALTTTSPGGPFVTVTDAGGGAGAGLTAMVENNVFDINSISVLWGLQRYTMGWLPFTMFQAFCRANPTLRRQPAVWTTHTEQNIFFVYPIPDQAYPIDIDATGLPYPLVNGADVDSQVIPPANDCVQYYGAHLALLKLQNFEQAEYYEKKYDTRVGQIIRTKQDRRITNIYRNAWRRINRW